jgi:hypothetical protein
MHRLAHFDHRLFGDCARVCAVVQESWILFGLRQALRVWRGRFKVLVQVIGKEFDPHNQCLPYGIQHDIDSSWEESLCMVNVHISGLPG